MLKVIFLIFFLSCTWGCTSLKTHQFVVHSHRPYDDERFYFELDQVIKKARVGNAANIPVPGFPYLRTNRFLIGLKDQLTTPSQNELWVEWMRKLDLEERSKEIQNLSALEIQNLSFQLGEPVNKETLLSQLSLYSERLLQNDKKKENFYKILKISVVDPGEYSGLMRTLGVYPLFYLPILKGTLSARHEFIKKLITPLDKIPVRGEIKSYGPKEDTLPNLNNIKEIIEPPGSFSTRGAHEGSNIEKNTLTPQIISPLKTNELGIPELSEIQTKQIVSNFAPVFSQDELSAYDRFGEVVFQNGKITIDLTKPTVYYYTTYSFINKQPVLQLNYVIWYLGRGGSYAPLLERGSLDGLTVRLTIDNRGESLIVDVMNNCGCYHFFAPKKERVKEAISHPWALAPLIPTWLPESFPEKRLVLRIQSGWHQVEHIDAREISNQPHFYQLVPYETLEVAPYQAGKTQSVFNDRGIMKNSNRIEPLIFFSSGISSVGSMRQRGNHPITLIGRSHFDDCDLFDKSFLFN